MSSICVKLKGLLRLIALSCAPGICKEGGKRDIYALAQKLVRLGLLG